MDTILIQQEGEIAKLILNRPDKLNTINGQMLQELNTAVNDLNARDEVRAVVITGAGKAFSAGADISQFTSLTPYTSVKLVNLAKQVFRQIETSTKPFIAMINGYALGGGLELAMSCDIRFSSDDAQLGLPEINLGIIPGFAGTQRLTKIVGKAKALEMMLTGDRIRAEEAERIGLVNKVFPKDQLEAETMKFAKYIAQKPPISVALIKTVVNYGAELPIEYGSMTEGLGWGVVFSTEDMKEGVAAFLQKRKGEFKGR